jgi:hypothetical protein
MTTLGDALARFDRMHADLCRRDVTNMLEDDVDPDVIDAHTAENVRMYTVWRAAFIANEWPGLQQRARRGEIE